MSTKRNLGESPVIGKNFKKLSLALKDGSIGISHLSQAVKDLIERGGDVPKDLIDIIIEMVNERMSSYATRAEVVNLQSQIDVINMRISGISITLNPRSQPVYVGNLATIDINVTTTDRASAIRLYRGDIPIYESSTETVTWSYTDTFTPASETIVVYRVVAIVGGVEKEATAALSVVKQEANIMWSSNEATVIMNTTNNFPYLSNIHNLPVTYETSDANVATINALGTMTLVGAGTANIIARFDGNNIYNPCIAQYTLTVQENSITNLLWTGAEILPNMLSIGDTATLYKGTVLAYYQSGRVEDVTDRSIVTAASGILSGDTYTATTIGTDILSVRFGNIVSRNTLVVNVGKVPTNIHWSAEEYTALIGGTNTYPELLGTTGSMVIAYRSSNESVADINANGIVTLVSEGTCTITASFAGDETREGSQDSYVLTVASPSVQRYTITFNTNGGSGDAPEPITADVGRTIALPLYNGTKQGYVLGNKWIINGQEWDFGGDYTLTGNVTAYCKWIGNRKTVQVGHGTDYNNAVFTDTGRQLSDNMEVSIPTNNGDYIFIKVDQNDTLNNLYFVDSVMAQNLSLESPVNVSGGYKYYKTTYQYRELNLNYILNRV